MRIIIFPVLVVVLRGQIHCSKWVPVDSRDVFLCEAGGISITQYDTIGWRWRVRVVVRLSFLQVPLLLELLSARIENPISHTRVAHLQGL